MLMDDGRERRMESGEQEEKRTWSDAGSAESGER
jgi:hypothetical protein